MSGIIKSKVTPAFQNDQIQWGGVPLIPRYTVLQEYWPSLMSIMESSPPAREEGKRNVTGKQDQASKALRSHRKSHLPPQWPAPPQKAQTDLAGHSSEAPAPEEPRSPSPASSHYLSWDSGIERRGPIRGMFQDPDGGDDPRTAGGAVLYVVRQSSTHKDRLHLSSQTAL